MKKIEHSAVSNEFMLKWQALKDLEDELLKGKTWFGRRKYPIQDLLTVFERSSQINYTLREEVRRICKEKGVQWKRITAEYIEVE